MKMEAHGVTKEHTSRQMAQRIPKSGNRKKENKRENPPGYQTLPEHQQRRPSRGSDLKPWMETRRNPHSLQASQPPYRPKHHANLALASRYDEQPPSPPAHKFQPYAVTTPRRDNPYSHVVSSDMLLARVRILNRMKPEPDDDGNHQHLHLHQHQHQHHHNHNLHHHHHHNLAKDHDREMENACDEQMRCRIETWLDGIEDFVPLERTTTPQKFRILIKNER